jgi:hypothetical protein
MITIDTKYSRPGAPVLNVDDAGGAGVPVIFQHGLCGDAQQTIEAFPPNPRFRRKAIVKNLETFPAITQCSTKCRKALFGGSPAARSNTSVPTNHSSH